jgi:ubiquinone/menaquinone biosynthesis C-methylase UbiE
MAPLNREEVRDANVEFHSQLADTFNETQPYMLPQNRVRVRAFLEKMAAGASPRELLDIGCGTGFIIELVAPLFDRIVGIDITPAMLDKVPRYPNVELLLAEAEHVPCESSRFGVVTAYSLLQHLHEYGPVFREVYRCLASGGIFYADESQNFYCAEALRNVSVSAANEALAGERQAVIEDARRYAARFNLEEHTVERAMFQGKMRGGVREEEVAEALKGAGFVDVQFMYHWFVGQRALQAERGEGFCNEHDAILQRLLPLTRPLYKYVGVVARKG